MLFHIQSLLFFFGSRIEIQQLPFFASACFTFAEIMYLYHVRSDKNTSLFRKHLSATQKQFKIDSIRFSQKCKRFFSHCAKKLCRFIVLPQCANKDYLFRIAECILYNENIPSFCATEKESPQFSPVELSSPGNLHFPVLCPVRAMVPLSSLHSYTGTGSQSPLCQMLT